MKISNSINIFSNLYMQMVFKCSCCIGIELCSSVICSSSTAEEFAWNVLSHCIILYVMLSKPVMMDFIRIKMNSSTKIYCQELTRVCRCIHLADYNSLHNYFRLTRIHALEPSFSIYLTEWHWQYMFKLNCASET